MQSNENEDSIINETDAFSEAWNSGDAKAAASFFASDGVRVGAFGDVQHGHAELEAAFTRLLHHTMPGAKVKQERGNVRMLTSDLALWQAGIEIHFSGPGSPVRGHVLQVMKKVGGRWLVLEAHPKFFPPTPAR